MVVKRSTLRKKEKSKKKKRKNKKMVNLLDLEVEHESAQVLI